MTPKEAMAVLLAAKPGMVLERVSVRLYEQALQDIPGPLLGAAVEELIRMGMRYFPAVSEIRRTAAALAGLLPPSPEEVLALIRAADVEVPVLRRDGSLAYTERYWAWPEGTPVAVRQAAQEVLRRVGDPVSRGARVFGWEQSARAAAECGEDEATRSVLADLSRAALQGGPVARQITGGS